MVIDGAPVDEKPTNATVNVLGFDPLVPITCDIDTGADVLAAKVASPPKLPSTLAVPGGSRFVDMEALPLVNENGPNAPKTFGGVLLSSAIKETASVLAGAGETVTVAVKVDPEGEPPLGLAKVVVVAVRMAEVHLANKFPTLIDPIPVAKSYPVPD